MANENSYQNLFISNSNCLSPEQMKLYLQNVLSPAEKRAVENHLLECEFCSDAMEGLKQLAVDNYQYEVDILNRQIKRRVKYNSRKNILYSPWKLIAVAASVLFLVLLTGIYFDWFLHTRFENVAKNIQDLSSKVSNLALLKKEEKKDTITIIKEKNNDNVYSSTATATDDISPLNEGTATTVDSAIAKEETMTVNNGETKNNAHQNLKDEENNTSEKNIAMADLENKTSKMKMMSSPSSSIPSANYNNNNSENQTDKKITTIKNPEENEGLKQYNAKNYTKAIASLNNVVTKEPTNYQAKYYLGMSYMQAGKYIEAIKQFDAIMVNNNSDWYDDARYQKALSHLKIDDMATAKNLLEQIVSENGKYKSDAQQQLDELNK